MSRNLHSESALTVSWTSTGLSLSGSLDDRTTADDLAQIIDLSRIKTGPVEIEVGGLKRGNSIGMLEWEKFAAQFKFAHYYSNSPFWLVNYFNMISSFFQNDQVSVLSIYAPFVCEDDESSENLLLTLGKEIPILESYQNFEVPDFKKNNKIYSPDFDARRYLVFIARNKARFDSFFQKHFPKAA